MSLSILNGVSCSPYSQKLLVAHRGASAYAPEHTLQSYRLAIEQGADYVEQDLQITKDGFLVCMHDPSLERTTNVEEVFPERAGSAGNSDGGRQRWWVADFTLEEIKSLDAGSWFDERFRGSRVPTFQEAIREIRDEAGLFPELKDPESYAERGFDMVGVFLRELELAGLGWEDSRNSRLIIQSFSDSVLRELARRGSRWPRVLLLSNAGRSWLTDEGLDAASEFATGIGPEKNLVLQDPSLVKRAHLRGLDLIPYTFRSSSVRGDFGSVKEEMRHYLRDLGVDGVFTDNPDQFPR